ncbi:MAG: YhgE/Pip domain-containing protein [Eubacterium sp.]|nr:YhgE/Pip domain-containing protein [Eubacterium sp.]
MAKKLKQLKYETKAHAFIKKYFMIIVVFAIMLIPSIYTVLFLGSMWDPYGNTGSLPVAIVNEDKPIYYDGKTVNIGEQLCDKLKKNDSLQFNFVDEQVALDGLENSTYYMVMVIPDDFSANSVTLTSDNPQKMQLEYYVNPGTNYIASKFGESAVKSIKEQINKTVINTYATTVYSKLGTIHDGFVQAADGSAQIGDGVGQLKDGNSQITDGLETLSAGCLTLKEGTGTLKDGLAQYTDGAQQIADGVSQLHDGVPQLTDGVGQLKDGTGQLVDGSGQLVDGSGQLVDGAAQLKDGTDRLVSNNDKLNDGAQQLYDGLNLMSDQLGESLTEENLNDLATLEDGLLQLNDGIQTLQKAINEDYRISDEKLAKIKKDIDEADKIVKTDSFRMLCILVSYSDLDYEELTARIDSLMQIASDEEKQVLNTLKTVIVMLEDVQDLRKLVTPENAQKLVDTAKKVLGAYEQLTSGVQQLSDGGNLALPVASDTLKKMTSGLQSVKNGLDRTVEKDGETGLIEGMGTLKDGIGAYTKGVSQVSDGAIQLNDGVGKLDSGISALDSGIGRVDEGVGKLGDGLTTAGKGIDKLYDGTQTLVSNNDKLNGGAGQLDDGAGQLYDGSLKLLDGSNQIGDGCDKLLDGAHLLESSLRDGALQIESTNTGADSAEMFSQPVDANETFQRTINTNGEAMSAYMMCAGLWVACLAFCLMFSPFNTSLKDRKTFRRHGIIAAFVAVIAPILMVTLIMGIDGMRPAHVIDTYVMAILTSCAFMAIVYMVNTMFDSIGSFMLLVLLCLQLSGAAGTYPIELSPKFYQIIHPFMPFTYGVDAFRSTISTGNSLIKDITVFVLISLMSFGLTQVTYHLRQIKLKRKAQTEAERAMEEEVDYYNHAI